MTEDSEEQPEKEELSREMAEDIAKKNRDKPDPFDLSPKFHPFKSRAL